jgi:hypothetical protein
VATDRRVYRSTFEPYITATAPRSAACNRQVTDKGYSNCLAGLSESDMTAFGATSRSVKPGPSRAPPYRPDRLTLPLTAQTVSRSPLRLTPGGRGCKPRAVLQKCCDGGPLQRVTLQQRQQGRSELASSLEQLLCPCCVLPRQRLVSNDLSNYLHSKTAGRALHANETFVTQAA